MDSDRLMQSFDFLQYTLLSLLVNVFFWIIYMCISPECSALYKLEKLCMDDRSRGTESPDDPDSNGPGYTE